MRDKNNLNMNLKSSGDASIRIKTERVKKEIDPDLKEITYGRLEHSLSYVSLASLSCRIFDHLDSVSI